MCHSSIRSIALAAAAFLSLPAMALASPGALAAEAGDPRIGEDLYVGARALANGGAPCLACHGVAGSGLARAASFGPDLTTAHATFGADTLAGALEEVAFPSMEPIYAKRPITPAERAHLVAFLAQASTMAPPALGAGFVAGVAAAAGIFLLFVLAVGRRRARRARPSAPDRLVEGSAP